MDSAHVGFGSSTGPRVAVVGAGTAGLMAARRLAETGVEVDVYEAGPRIGGQVHTIDFCDRRIDVGAEALHAIPPVLALLEELGLVDDVVRANGGQTWIWNGRRLRRLPAGVGPAGPTRLGPVLAARVLSIRGLGRAAMEPLLPRSPAGTDQGVGTYLTHRFGSEVTDRLVDPVLGSLHAGDVGRLSMEATAPQLAAMARDHRSLLLAHRARRQLQRSGGGAPDFLSFEDGLSRFVDRLHDLPGITVHTGTQVTAIRPSETGFVILGQGAELVSVNGLVLATSAPTAARLLDHAVPDVAWHLSQAVARTASVATVVTAYPRAAVESIPALAGKGMLVASSAGRLLKAATFLSTKWPHLDHPDFILMRLSAGRAGDDTLAELDDAELVNQLHVDLFDAIGLTAAPVEARVIRWPDTMAQLEVGHNTRVRTARDRIAEHPLVGGGRLALAGASYDGLGIAACLRSGESAAAAVAQTITSARPAASGPKGTSVPSGVAS